MRKMLCLTAVLLFIAAAAPVSAQSFGELFPLTNTRYDRAIGTPRLAANGSDFFLFWSTERKIRATSLAQGEPRVGHVVLSTSGAFDVAWTGEVFLLVSSRLVNEHSPSLDANIVGRILDANAQPLGDEFLIAEHAREPRIAAGPEGIVMVYRGTANDTRVLVLGTRGQSTGAESFKVATAGMGYAVVANDSGFLVASSDKNELRTVKLDRQGRAAAEHTIDYPMPSYREVALATDGERFLLAWCTNGPGGTAVIPLDENGSFGTTLVIGGGFARSLSAVSTVAGWSVSLDSNRGTTQLRAHVYHLDRDVTTNLSREQSTELGVGNPTIAVLKNRTMAAWTPVGNAGASSVVELPIAAHQPRVATFAATQQTLLATTSSAGATLMIWSEHSDDGTSIHAGIRTHDGQWSERELTTPLFFTADAALAASDGTHFAVILQGFDIEKGINVQKVMRLDELGRPYAAMVNLPGTKAAMAWNGTNYAIITGPNQLQGRLLSPAGALSAAVTIPRSAGDAFSGNLALASNGDGFFLAGERIECQFLLCGARTLKGMRLNANLERIDAEELTLESEFGKLGGAVWNGSDYVVAWKNISEGFFTARVPAGAGAPISIAHANADIAPTSVAAMTDGTVAVAGPAGASNVTRVAFVRNGSLTQSFDIDSSTLTGTPLLAALADGVAYVASSVQDAAPHHGTSHVMMAIARPTIPLAPNPPHVTARLQDGILLVDWSAASGTLNGYRLEYRVDGGAWTEVEDWFAPSSSHSAIRQSFGTNLEVRMRAFNDGGAGAYSDTATATTKPVRRRAAR